MSSIISFGGLFTVRPPHTKIIIIHNEPPFHSCIYYSAIGDEYQKFKLIISSSAFNLSLLDLSMLSLRPLLVFSFHTQIPIVCFLIIIPYFPTYSKRSPPARIKRPPTAYTIVIFVSMLSCISTSYLNWNAISHILPSFCGQPQ